MAGSIYLAVVGFCFSLTVLFVSTKAEELKIRNPGLGSVA